MLEAIFFDFDGVILNSEHIKENAFSEMYAGYGDEIRTAVMEYHHGHRDKSRYEQFTYYHEQLLGMKVTDVVMKELSRQFNELTLENILAAPFMPGALQTLTALKEKGIPSFVASGTPQQELRFIVEKRGIETYFTELHGSPKTKNAIIRDVRRRYGVAGGNCVFVGDGVVDCKAAQQSGVPFLGVKSPESGQFPEGTPIVERLSLEAIEGAAGNGETRENPSEERG